MVAALNQLISAFTRRSKRTERGRLPNVQKPALGFNYRLIATGNGNLGYAMLEVVLSLMIFAAVAMGYVTLYRQLQLHAADMMQRSHAQNLVDNMTAQLVLDRASSCQAARSALLDMPLNRLSLNDLTEPQLCLNPIAPQGTCRLTLEWRGSVAGATSFIGCSVASESRLANGLWHAMTRVVYRPMVGG